MARTSLDMGVPNFIDQDFNEWRDVAKLAGLLPMLPKINLLDLLGQHDSRWVRGESRCIESSGCHPASMCPGKGAAAGVLHTPHGCVSAAELH